MTSNFVPTATNMVALVRNIIQGYRMGSVRALAQEPVQNSKDAAAKRGVAHVEYRLHQRTSSNGGDIYILTVTDSKTTGLRGPVHSLEDIVHGEALTEGENWAAFEGMGYTKKSTDDALGTRGQGKAAFLYHSRLPRVSSSGQDRMMILYDTLLADGTYRLGVRYASPSDTVQAPPFTGDQARSTVSSSYISEDSTEIELGLDPLASVGTRIIVPHLSQEAVEAIHSGELYQWLQRCWWRAIQTGLNINVVDELGNTKSVAVPSWWQAEPWKKSKSVSGVRVYNRIDIADALRIKRIVLLYDESLDDSDIDGVSPQFCGVQLLRGQQWIETLGLELSDYIPRDKRPGFRGFVEFDRHTESELRRAENSQHESFDRRMFGVRPLITAIENKVKEFAKEQGWTTEEITRPAPRGEQDAAMEFLRFLSPNARRNPKNGRAPSYTGQLEMDMSETDRWECNLRLDFPDPSSARVDWGQEIRNVEVDVRLEPQRSKRATVSLEVAYAADKTSVTSVESLELDLLDGNGVAQFNDFQVITGQPAPKKLSCARVGKYRLTARVESNGFPVARSSRNFYVKEEPPLHDSNLRTVSISAENHTTPQRRRINSGDTLGVQISVTNRTSELQTLALTASLGDLLLADKLQVEVEGTPPGASPVRVAGLQRQITVNPTIPGHRQSIQLPAGRHNISADLYLNEEIVAHASHPVYVDVDPVQPEDWPPFQIEEILGERHPRWQFRRNGQDDLVLQYPPAYPLYRALDASPSRSGTRLSGVSAFVVDVCAEGIVEWAMEPLDESDSSRLDLLLGDAPAGAKPDIWEHYREKMQELAGLRRDPKQVDRYGHLVRECAALSLSLFEERR